MNGKEFKKEVCRLLEYGIEQYGTRYDAQSKLIYHYWIIGYTKEQTKEAIRDWYHSHNHQSRTWQTHPGSALNNANNAVESLYNNKKRNNQAPYRSYGIQLRVGDVSKIISITPDYRMQKFIFGILRYATNKRETGNEFDLPWEAIIKLDCCSDKTYQERIEFCKSIGLLEIIEECSRSRKQARKYRINFPYASDGISVNSLEEGLKALLPLDELRRKYNKWYFKKIKNV